MGLECWIMRNKWDTFMAVADLERFFKTITADVVYIQWCIVLTWIASLASGISLSKSCASFAANITSSVVLRLYVQGTWETFYLNCPEMSLLCFLWHIYKICEHLPLESICSRTHFYPALPSLALFLLSLSLSLSLSQFILWVVDGSCPEENFQPLFSSEDFLKNSFALNYNL